MPIARRFHRPKNVHIPLQWALVFPFVLQMAGVVGLVGYLSYRSGQQAIEKMAFQLMENVDQHVSHELYHYLQSAQELNQRQHSSILAEVISPQNLNQLHRYLILRHQQIENLTTLLFGTPQGDLLVSHRVSPRDYGVTTRLTPEELPFEAAISMASEPSINQTYAVDASGNLGRHLKTVENIDVRDRPWYQAAVTTGKPGWTRPFQIADTNLLALNAYTPIYDEANQLLGVFAVNISLNQLSDFLSNIEVGSSGEVFIMERSGELIATSTTEAVYTTSSHPDLDGASEPGTFAFQRRSPQDLANPLIQKSYQYLRETFEDFATLQSFQETHFSWQGKRYFLTIAPYKDAYGLDWLIVTVVPEADFTAEIQQNVRTTVILCLLALGGAIASSTLFAKQIAAHFAQLNQAGKALAHGNLDQQLPTNSTITEIYGVTKSFNQMAAQLRSLFQNQVATEATRQSEARFQTLVDAVPGSVYAYTRHPDGSHRFDYINEVCRDILDLEPEQVIANPDLVLNQIHPDDRLAFCQSVDHSAKTLEPFTLTFRYLPPSGGMKWLEASCRPLQKPDGSLTWYSLSLDVSDRRQAAIALEESELRYRILAESSPVGIFRHDKDGRCIYANAKTLEVIGLSLEETLSGEWGKYLHPEDRDRVYATWENFVDQVNRGENASYEIEQRYLFPDGSLKWGLAQAAPERNALGEVMGFVGSIADISARKQAEEALQAKTEELDRFFSVALDLLCIANNKGEFLRLNPQWEETLGYSLQALEGSRFLDYVHPADVAPTLEVMALLKRNQKISNFVNRYRHQDGSYRWIEWRSVSIGALIYAAARDITDRRQMEEAIRSSEARKQAILSAIPDLILLINAEGLYLESIRSNAVVDIVETGVNPVGKHISEVVSPKIARRHLQAIRQVLQTHQPITYEQQVWFGDRLQHEEIVIVPCEEDTAILIVRDISVRKQIELALRQSEQKFRGAFDTITTGMALVSIA